MSCRDIEAKLLGGLETRLDQAVREHVRHCSSCRALQEELEEIEDLYRSLARTEKAPRDFAGRVIPRVSPAYRLRGPFIAGSIAFAALLAATFFVTSPVGNSDVAPSLGSGRVFTYESRPVEFNLDSPQTQIFVLDSAQTKLDSAQTKEGKVETHPPRRADRVENGLLRYVSY